MAEGWDNPNVFQICTLVNTKSTKDKRQKIGRGLRLCVNQNGVRIHDPSVNLLTVMANESFEEFAAGLQHEYEETSGIKFGIIEKHSFSNIAIKDDDGNIETLGESGSTKIYQTFLDIGYINEEGHVQDSLKKDIKQNDVKIPDEYKNVANQIINICKQISGTHIVKNCDDKRAISFKKEVLLGPDFKELWDKIKYKTRYELNFDSDELIKQCAEGISSVTIRPPTLMYEKAGVKIDNSGVTTNASIPVRVETLKFDDDLPDIITYLQNKTDLTRRTIVKILTDKKVNLDNFKMNPQMFMEESAKIILNKVQGMAKKGITYTKIGDYYAQELFDSEEIVGYLNKNMIPANRSISDYIVYDSDIEMEFAKQLDNMPDVKLFVKLPDWFKIDTPIGSYNPDWAILIERAEESHLYFVFETKGNVGNNRPSEEFKIECGRKHFEALKSDVKYEVGNDMKKTIEKIAYGDFDISNLDMKQHIE